MKCFFILIIILQFVTANIFLVKISNQTYETNDILQEEYSSALYEKHRYGSEDNDDEMGLLDYSGYFSETFRNRRKSKKKRNKKKKKKKKKIRGLIYSDSANILICDFQSR